MDEPEPEEDEVIVVRSRVVQPIGESVPMQSKFIQKHGNFNEENETIEIENRYGNSVEIPSEIPIDDPIDDGPMRLPAQESKEIPIEIPIESVIEAPEQIARKVLIAKKYGRI